MLPKKPARQDTETLCWEYLDGVISPTRAEVLSSLLSERAGARDQFVECAVMHGMLHALFNDRETPADQGMDRPKKRRRSSAA